MQIEYGALVEDKDNKVLGKVDYIVRDTWSGEQRKFMVRRDAPQTDIFFTPEHIAETTEEKVKLNISLEELEGE
ncbi:MAG TPA: hypothetical protein G4O10_09770 [Dehalococcoidia bacterium]|nr:hypothetical protein [Dehalococcoidia bacterium]